MMGLTNEHAADLDFSTIFLFIIELITENQDMETLQSTYQNIDHSILC